jgi:hypothetical protein
VRTEEVRIGAEVRVRESHRIVERQGQVGDQEEWEPSGLLMGALREMPLLPGMDQNWGRATLEPHLEEALRTLERLEGQRGLSEREKTRAVALRMLLASIERVQ